VFKLQQFALRALQRRTLQNKKNHKLDALFRISAHGQLWSVPPSCMVGAHPVRATRIVFGAESGRGFRR
jgi:hypothetical protein